MREYVYLEGKLLAQYDYSTSATEPTQNYYVNDHLGTPVFMVDRNPQQTYDLETGPFGERYGEFKLAGITQPLRLPGQYDDIYTVEESNGHGGTMKVAYGNGFYQNWNRDYDPSLGIYLQSDRLDALGRTNDPELLLAQSLGVLRLPQGLINNQSYGYANQNPVMYWDFTGLSSLIIPPDDRCWNSDECFKKCEEGLIKCQGKTSATEKMKCIDMWKYEQTQCPDKQPDPSCPKDREKK